MTEDAHFRLRIPRPLKEWVEENAKRNNRSINAEIVFLLESMKDDVQSAREKQAAMKAVPSERKTLLYLDLLVLERSFQEFMMNSDSKWASDPSFDKERFLKETEARQYFLKKQWAESMKEYEYLKDIVGKG